MKRTKINIAILFTSALMVLLQAPECHGTTLGALLHRCTGGVKSIIKAPFILTARAIKAVPETLHQYAKRHPYISLAAFTSSLLATACIAYCCHRYGIKTTLNAPINFFKKRIHDLKIMLLQPKSSKDSDNAADPLNFRSQMLLLKGDVLLMWSKAELEVKKFGYPAANTTFCNKNMQFFKTLHKLEELKNFEQIFNHLMNASEIISQVKEICRLKALIIKPLKDKSENLWQEAYKNLKLYTDARKNISSNQLIKPSKMLQDQKQIFDDKADLLEQDDKIDNAKKHFESAQAAIENIFNSIKKDLGFIAEDQSNEKWSIELTELIKQKASYKGFTDYRDRFDEEARKINNFGTTQQFIEFLNTTETHIAIAHQFNNLTTKAGAEKIQELLRDPNFSKDLIRELLAFKNQHAPELLLFQQFKNPQLLDIIEQTSQKFDKILEKYKPKKLIEANHHIS